MSDLTLRRNAQDDVELRRQFADARAFHGGKVHDDGFAGLGVADAAQDAVPFVAGLTLDVALRGEEFLAALLDLEVDMRRPPRVRDRLDSAEIVFAAGPGQKAAEA